MQGIGNKYYRIKRQVRGVAAELAWSSGIHKKSITGAKGCRILIYHGICLKDHLKYNTLFISLPSFERQIKLYKKYACLISLDDYYSGNYDPSRFNICLTFDDGYANNLKYALPLLEKYRIPATFFITGVAETGQDILWNDVLSLAYVHGPDKIQIFGIEYGKGKDGKYVNSSGQSLYTVLRNKGWSDKEKMIAQLDKWKEFADKDFWLQLKPDEIKKLSASEFTSVGCHGYYHNDLAKISIGEAKSEMTRSRSYLEKISGKTIKAIAFPYGSYNPDVIRAAKEAGFEQLLATNFLSQNDSNDTTLKQRLTINPFITATQQFRANIAGKY
jgi:peptidoglycan/xylan/chitin deacetylase (PgdA/CDA1 family)